VGGIQALEQAQGKVFVSLTIFSLLCMTPFWSSFYHHTGGLPDFFGTIRQNGENYQMTPKYTK
jgi:hypothetical protein